MFDFGLVLDREQLGEFLSCPIDPALDRADRALADMSGLLVGEAGGANQNERLALIRGKLKQRLTAATKAPFQLATIALEFPVWVNASDPAWSPLLLAPEVGLWSQKAKASLKACSPLGPFSIAMMARRWLV